jgi:hypothetical protein
MLHCIILSVDKAIKDSSINCGNNYIEVLQRNILAFFKEENDGSSPNNKTNV